MDGCKEMCYRLFNKITDVINELETVQMETEEMFISQESNQEVPKIYTEEENIN